MSAVPQQLYKDLYLVLVYVLLEQFAVVVDQSSYCVLGQHTVADLTLHCTQELVGYLLLWVWGWGLRVMCVGVGFESYVCVGGGLKYSLCECGGEEGCVFRYIKLPKCLKGEFFQRDI